MSQSQPGRASLKASLNAYFGAIPDPRVERTRSHQLLDIITIALLGILAGADGWVAIATYGQSKQAWLSTFLDLPNGIPSHDTFGRVFARLCPQQLEQQFQAWMQLLLGQLERQVIAFDGKTLRGSYDREAGLAALQLVSAWASQSRLVLGQAAVATKSNEITAIPLLLNQLDVSGCVVSLDAMGTQTSIAQQIQATKADYILALKGNQPRLMQAATTWFEQAQGNPPDDTSINTGHHRIETRHLWQVPAHQVFDTAQCDPWTGLKTLVAVQSQRQLAQGETQAVRYYLTSCNTDAQTMAQYIRAHWGVENQLHWCLDVIFQEDASRLRKDHAPRNFSLMRRLALNLLRQEPSRTSLKMKRYQAALDNHFLLKILTHVGIK